MGFDHPRYALLGWVDRVGSIFGLVLRVLVLAVVLLMQ